MLPSHTEVPGKGVPGRVMAQLYSPAAPFHPPLSQHCSNTHILTQHSIFTVDWSIFPSYSHNSMNISSWRNTKIQNMGLRHTGPVLYTLITLNSPGWAQGLLLADVYKSIWNCQFNLWDILKSTKGREGRKGRLGKASTPCMKHQDKEQGKEERKPHEDAHG